MSRARMERRAWSKLQRPGATWRAWSRFARRDPVLWQIRREVSAIVRRALARTVENAVREAISYTVSREPGTFACQYLERGGQLAALQAILGHASIETTMRYAGLTDEVVRRDAERVNA